MGLRTLLSCFRKGSTSSPNNATAPDEVWEEQPRGGAVLVELFSSQGCKASPEAEEVVARLERGELGPEVVPVVVLDFHVDYWDYLGWKDPLASSLWTVRQKAYVEALGLDTLFTPLAVVHGRSQCLATDQDALLSAVQSAPRFPNPSFQASFKRASPDALEVTMTGSLRLKMNESERAVMEVMVALYEKGVETDCSKGENRGGRLHHDYAVRGLAKLKTASAGKKSSSTVTGTIGFSLWEGFNSSSCGLVLFVQNASSFQVLGVQQLDLPHTV